MNEKKLLQIIEQAAKKEETWLYLSGRGLRVLPPEIAQLTNLIALDLRNNQLSAKLTIECPEAIEDVSVTQLLFGLDWNTQDEVLSRLDEIETTIVEGQDEILEGQEVILDEFKNLRELTQREFTNAFRREQAKIDSHCPNVFVLRPRDGKGWRKATIGQKLDLQLYCQAPGCWHPTQKGGLYEIDEPAKWLRVTAPYIGRLVRVLKFAAPIVGPWLGVVDEKQYETLFKNDLELFKEVAAKLPELKDSDDTECPSVVALLQVL